MSTGILLYSCGISSRVIFRVSEENRPSFLRVTLADQSEITISTFVFITNNASTMLLILFYFANSIIVFLECMITFSTFFSVAFTIWDCINYSEQSEHLYNGRYLDHSRLFHEI
jgi:hypothetical protein